ncbi:signal peptidase I [Candidatus Dojkabacteria bacterium]|nr:signal peptidase I [Candidatus Dojkabacteria bacterium]
MKKLFFRKIKSLPIIVLILFAILIFCGVTLVPIIYILLLQPVQINGKAMAPTLSDGSMHFILKGINNVNYVSRGDIIVYKSKTDSKIQYVHRIIGMPGDKILLKNSNIYINGEILEEAYLNQNVETNEDEFLKENQSITVPPDSYFVLGDNRKNSQDSRHTGFIPKENIVGKIWICYARCQ